MPDNEGPGQAPEAGIPAQAWASGSGLIELRSLGPADWSAPALTARLQIEATLVRFAIAHDEARIDVVRSCFTADAIYEVLQAGRRLARFAGTYELEQGLGQVLRMQGDQRRHLISNVLVDDLDLSRGHATAFAVGLVGVSREHVTLGASVLYRAALRREPDGCWRIGHLTIGMDAITAPSS